MLQVNTQAGAAGGAERETESRGGGGRCLVTGLEDKVEDSSWEHFLCARHLNLQMAGDFGHEQAC